MEEKIVHVINEMAEVLNISQLKRLQEVLLNNFSDNTLDQKVITNEEYLEYFIVAKKIEGCSDRTIDYYRVTVKHFLSKVEDSVRKIPTETIRQYLMDYQAINNCSNVTIDNIRRNISSFFTWLEEEDYILKSPMRRIHKIKSKQTVKEVITDEDIEKIRDICDTKRDLAIIDLLYSTGMRVGELVNLNIQDINFSDRECVVFGKGESERVVYFDARCKIHLQQYLATRCDDNPALFVRFRKPYDRLGINGVEIRLKKLGEKSNVRNVHPHKFRRTLATKAIDKGMPIEQVQMLLGHVQIDTTMQYAMVNQSNVKIAHRKFIS